MRNIFKNVKKRFYCIAVVMVIFSSCMAFSPLEYKMLPSVQVAEVQAATTGEQNALSKAKSYLQMMAFSKKGLIKQLKFEGFTDKEAKYGAAKCKANWKKQAVRKAKSYLEIMSFSKKGLIKQLKFDGFTDKEAKYGAKKAGY